MKGGLSVLCLIWCWVKVPEPKGRTFEVSDSLFARGMSTRVFKNYYID